LTKILSSSNLTNAALCFVAIWPSVACSVWLCASCSPGNAGSWLCDAYLRQPVLTVNILYFFNVSVGFWVLGLMQRSFWLIDPYWTLLPPLIAVFYASHPLALPAHPRSIVADVLLLLWAVRLTRNYFRREEWKFGQREDWRYTKMAEENPELWWLLSFFAVGLAQQPLLCLFTAPYHSIHSVEAPLGLWDLLALVMCLGGLLIAHVADEQLWEFGKANERRVARGEPKEPLLCSGVWGYSRHPNYVGEQLWWWGLAVCSLSLGHRWSALGTLINSIVLAVVTVMTEQKMLTSWPKKRAALYQEYQRSTPVWIPLLAFRSKRD